MYISHFSKIEYHIKNLVRIILRIAMIGAEIGHLTFVRDTFQVLVSDFVPFSKDFIVLASRIMERFFGLAVFF